MIAYSLRRNKDYDGDDYTLWTCDFCNVVSTGSADGIGLIEANGGVDVIDGDGETHLAPVYCCHCEIKLELKITN